MARSRFLLLVLALVAGVAHAQLKAPGPKDDIGTLRVPPARLELQATKEEAAREAAEKWLALLDAGEYGKAWDQCAQLFRERVPRQSWVESLPATRAPYGAIKSRRAEVVSYKTSLPGAPDGEYVSARFATAFEKKADAEELLTLTFENGAWRPTGYLIR